MHLIHAALPGSFDALILAEKNCKTALTSSVDHGLLVWDLLTFSNAELAFSVPWQWSNLGKIL